MLDEGDHIGSHYGCLHEGKRGGKLEIKIIIGVDDSALAEILHPLGTHDKIAEQVPG